MNVLITGGTGSIGSYVIRELIANKDKVVAYDYLGEMSLLSDLKDSFTLIKGDITDQSTLIKAIKDHSIDSIVHMATYMEENDLFKSYSVNVKGTMTLLESARVMDIKRVVYCSAFPAVIGHPSGEFGHPKYTPVSEDEKGTPVTTYGATKLFGENMGSIYHTRYSMDFVVTRFASMYGLGRFTRHGSFPVVDTMVLNSIRGQKTLILKGGDAVQDWTYTKDAAYGTYLALKTLSVRHDTFHIGAGKGYTLKQVARILKEQIPGANIEVGDGLDLYNWGIPSGFVLDTSKAKKLLGYEPRYDLTSGLKNYIEDTKKLL